MHFLSHYGGSAKLLPKSDRAVRFEASVGEPIWSGTRVVPLDPRLGHCLRDEGSHSSLDECSRSWGYF